MNLHIVSVCRSTIRVPSRSLPSTTLVVVALLLAVLTSRPIRAQGNEQSAEARHQAECRLAHQVLTKGQPAVKTSWAIEKIDTCGELGGEAIAAALRKRSDAVNRSKELDELVLQTDELIDRRIFEAALEIARSPSAGAVARVEAIRVMHFQVDSAVIKASYQEYTQSGDPVEGVFHVASSDVPVVGQPLPANAVSRALSILQEIRNDSSAPDVVRTAAGNVAVVLRRMK